MADRYWVGGTASWDATAGTKWALTSGGAGGQAVPTAADDVYFDAASGAVTVTVNGTANCLSLNFTGFTGTFAGTSSLVVSGGVTFVPGMTLTFSGLLNFVGTSTFNFNTGGKTLPGNVQLNSTSLVLNLQSALTTSGSLTIAGGTFNTNNFNVTAVNFISNSGLARTLNFGSSTVSISGTGTTFTATSINLTFNAGTSQINLTSNSSTGLNTSGVTFYNVTATAATTSFSIAGENTFNNLTVAAPASAGVVQVLFANPQTINGTLSTTGTAGNRRVWFLGSTYGIAQTLTINSAPSLTDADFRDIYVIGTAAPISGTRIGDLRGIRGITASTPKTVYWNLAGAQNWSANGWATTSTGTPSTDNFPLAQDTATFTNAGSVTGTITMNSAIPYTGTVDMSGRTIAMTLNLGAPYTIYGDWANGSGTTIVGSNSVIFSGRNIQTVTSAGKAFTGNWFVDTYGGTVQLADALNTNSAAVTVTNGTFDTKNYNVTTAGGFTSSNFNVRTINLGSSTVTSSGDITFSNNINLTFNSGTSQINFTATTTSIDSGTSGVTFYNVAFTAASANATRNITNGPCIFNNLTVTAPSSASISSLVLSTDQTINGTLTVAGATPIRRVFVRSSTVGRQRDLTVGTLVATDCDFRDIELLGAAAGSAPTRAGDCGGNAGITFPAPKTVYWNLAGTQNWSATAWAPSSGGTPDINNFPLAQDTAVFDDAGAAGTVSLQVFNTGSVNASARTSAITLNWAIVTTLYGNWTNSTAVAITGTGTLTFCGRGTQTITSAGVAFTQNFIIESATGTVQLADALTLNAPRTLTLNNGTFDAVNYNVTTSAFICTAPSSVTPPAVLKMGTATWTLAGTGTVFNANASNFTCFQQTANIVLSSTSTSARTFTAGVGAVSFNKLTIGGATGTSTTGFSLSGPIQFTEIASTKTVAHTIDFSTATITFGKWSVTGTAGNVVTLAGTTTSLVIAGACTDGIDYLAMGSVGFAATSPGEFYAGANSTGTAAAPVYRTAKPADSTRYWVGGTGNWSDTARWSTGSGGAGGASVPRSHDDVVFDSASNATAYTATVNAVTGGIRTKALTIAGPASGNLTLAGSTAIDGIHGNVTLPATGLTRTYTGTITLSGSAAGRTITTNGVILGSTVNINGVGCEWSLGGAINSNLFQIITGNFLTNNYNLTTQGLWSNYLTSRYINLGSSTLSISGFNQPVNFGTTANEKVTLIFDSGASQISIGATNFTFSGNDQVFNNVSFTGNASSTSIINGANIFNDLSFNGRASAGVANISITASQTIYGTLTLSAGTNATMRTFLRSDIIGTTRTLTVSNFSAGSADIDFRDITIAGAAAPISGTRFGDCNGNSGITFPAAKTVYWRAGGGSDWGSNSWSATNGGALDITQVPLAQDTAVFPSSPTPYPSSGQSISFNAGYNIGTIDMSARTTSTMTLSVSQNLPIHGNWINGTGITLTGIGVLTFAGRGSQTITSAGRTFTQPLTIDTPGGSVTLQDAFSSSSSGNTAIQVIRGSFIANDYNVTLSAGGLFSSNSNIRTIAVGSGLWTLGGSGTNIWGNATATNLTVTGTGTLSFTNASTKSFNSGGLSFSGITLNQGGAGALTITSNSTLANISNTYKSIGATTIALGTSTQRVANFTASGEAGRVLTIQGTSASNPATLVFIGSGKATQPATDYLTITGVRAYSLDTTWYAGANSKNNGSLGWYFEPTPGGAITVFIVESTTANSSEAAAGTLNSTISELSTGSEAASSNAVMLGTLSESVTIADAIVAIKAFYAEVIEATTAADVVSAAQTLAALISESAQGQEAVVAQVILNSLVADSATMSDSVAGGLEFTGSVAEAAAAAESLLASLTVAGNVSELATAQDLASVLASTFSAASAETARPLDATRASATFPTALSESAQISEASASAFTAATAVSEAATASELSSSLAVFGGQIAELVIGLDAALVVASTFSASASEIAQARDFLNAPGSIYNVSMSESANLSDSFVGSYLWNPIDDTQTPNWQNINNAQSVTWTTVPDTQNPGWVIIPTSND